MELHGAATPQDAARQESDAPFVFPVGTVRVVETASTQLHWRLVTVYRGAKMIREYDVQPLEDSSWGVHRATVYC